MDTATQITVPHLQLIKYTESSLFGTSDLSPVEEEINKHGRVGIADTIRGLALYICVWGTFYTERHSVRLAVRTLWDAEGEFFFDETS